MSTPTVIVKLQVDTTGKRVLIYDESRKITQQHEMTDDLRLIMEGLPLPGKRYMYASVTAKRIELVSPAPDQDW